jgi:two-component system response regulator FlrC
MIKMEGSMQELNKILVVDDELDMRVAIMEALTRKGYSVGLAEDGREALSMLDASQYAMVISDVKMPGIDGIELLKEIKLRGAHIPVLIMSAFGTIEKAVEAVKEGAVDFILKPFDLEALESLVERSLKDCSELLTFETNGKSMLTVDPFMRKLISMAETASSSDATVLLSGESGTGKELLARFIHTRSSRRDNPFVPVNCASIPDGLLESELFGHEKGAFTGASMQRQGKFEQANMGTILLDEISEMDLKLQAKILRVIQEKEVERLGSKVTIKLDIRIIATTNRNIKEEVAEGRFREDLFYRLNIFPLTLPPLRERGADIENLADYFMRKFNVKYSKHLEAISEAALEEIRGCKWRGNIRELENALERAVLLSHGTVLELECFDISSDLLPEEVSGHGQEAAEGVSGADAEVNNMTLREMERVLIYKTLDGVEWNRTQAAGILGISVRTLRNKLKEYGQLLPG